MRNYSDDMEAVACSLMAIQKHAKDNGLQLSLPPSYLNALCENYDQPWRKYHTLTHIAEGCKPLLGLWEKLNDPISVMLGWHNHDIIFLPGASMNEECSAQFLESKLSGHVSKTIIERAGAMVRLTKKHMLPKPEHFCGDMQDLAIFLGTDLANLGAPHDKFVADGELIRDEAGLSEANWVTIRAEFARSFLDRPRVFEAPEFHYLEAQAQENLNWADDMEKGS